MATDSERKNPSRVPTSPPPPPQDPFTRYQTPWPRHRSEEGDPFIQFRRFADDTFRSFFSRAPFYSADCDHSRRAGIPISQVSQRNDSDSSEDLGRGFGDMLRQGNEIFEGIKKRIDQEIEEKRQKMASSHHERHPGRNSPPLEKETSSRPWWQRGNAAKCPGIHSADAESMSRCPALYNETGQPRTELDVYERAEQAVNTNGSPRKNCRRSDHHRSSWFSRLGHDGRIQQLSKHYQEPTSPSSNSDDQQHQHGQVHGILGMFGMNPFTNSSETLPWLLLSPYSPIYLCNPQQNIPTRVRISDEPEQPFRLCETEYPSPPSKWSRRFDIHPELARRLSWADAFEDLLSLEHTGMMIEREASTYRTPPTWIHDMVYRGSLGSRWGFDEQGRLMTFPNNSQNSRIGSVTDMEDTTESTGEVQQGQSWALVDPRSATTKASTAFDNTEQPKLMPEDVLDAISTIMASEISSSNSDDDAQHDYTTSTASREGWPSTEALSSTSNSTWTTSPSQEHSPGTITSLMTRTESRTLPDGSIETKKVLRRRFADGREENEESVDISQPQLKQLKGEQKMTRYKESQVSKSVQTGVNNRKHEAGGWFWR